MNRVYMMFNSYSYEAVVLEFQEIPINMPLTIAIKRTGIVISKHHVAE